MKRVLKIVGSAVGIIFILVALDVLGILGLSYPAAVKNNPLINPVRVLCITNDIMQMADGRCFYISDGSFLEATT